MRVVDIRDFSVPSDENDYDELVAFADTMASISPFDAVPMSVIDDIRAEILDCMTDGIEYYDCGRDDGLKLATLIIDKHIEKEKE